MFGDGLQWRDFTYVDDCVDALLAAAASDAANGQRLQPREQRGDLPAEPRGAPRSRSPEGSFELVDFPADRKQIDIGDYYGSTAMIESDLGWQPRVDLREGLKRTLAFYRSNASHYWDAP